MSKQDSVNKKDGVLTLEILEDAFSRIQEKSGTILERIVSHKAHVLLEKIREIEPGWDCWTFESEIYYKANNLGIKHES